MQNFGPGGPKWEGNRRKCEGKQNIRQKEILRRDGELFGSVFFRVGWGKGIEDFGRRFFSSHVSIPAKKCEKC